MFEPAASDIPTQPDVFDLGASAPAGLGTSESP
jgi:hypothetical protein